MITISVDAHFDWHNVQVKGAKVRLSRKNGSSWEYVDHLILGDTDPVYYIEDSTVPHQYDIYPRADMEVEIIDECIEGGVYSYRFTAQDGDTFAFDWTLALKTYNGRLPLTIWSDMGYAIEDLTVTASIDGTTYMADTDSNGKVTFTGLPNTYAKNYINVDTEGRSIYHTRTAEPLAAAVSATYPDHNPVSETYTLSEYNHRYEPSQSIIFHYVGQDDPDVPITGNGIKLVNSGDIRDIPHIMSAQVSKALTGEQTLSVELLPEDVPYVSDTTQILCEGQLYNVTSYTKQTLRELVSCKVEAEHIGYSLTDERCEADNITGGLVHENQTRKALLGALLTDTDFVDGTVDDDGLLHSMDFTGKTKREALNNIASLAPAMEIEPNGKAFRIVAHRGSADPIDIMNTGNVTDVGVSHNAITGETSYTLSLGRRGSLNLGDEIHLKFDPMGIDLDTRIVSITYDPYDPTECSVEVGAYTHTIYEEWDKSKQKQADDFSEDFISLASMDSFTNALGSVMGKTITRHWDSTHKRYNYTIT